MEQHSTLDHKEQQKSTRIFQEEFGQDYKVLGDSFMDWWNQTGIVWTYGPAVCLACERPGLWPEEYHLHGQAWRWVIDDVGLLFCGRNWQSWSCTCIMDSQKYQAILKRNVMPSVDKLNLGDHWTFQQDNDPKHTSKSNKAWLSKRPWNVLEWPSQSPDLNPIENLWWDLKKAVAARKPSNITELEAFAHEDWFDCNCKWYTNKKCQC